MRRTIAHLDAYYDALDHNEFPVMRGIELSSTISCAAQSSRHQCHFELSIESIEIAHLIRFREYFCPWEMLEERSAKGWCS